MFTRAYSQLDTFFRPGEVLVIYGPRRVGKTTLLKHYLEQYPYRYRLETGEDIRIQTLLASQDLQKLQEYVNGYRLIAIDEAQTVPNIGMGLKMLIDHNPHIQFIATGSSSFDLSHTVGEPLTGRKTTLTLFPLSQYELQKQMNRYDLKQKLEEYLIFGSYPQVLTATATEEKVRIINELVSSYIFKDILALERIKGATVLFNLLKLLAFQIGSEVSMNELSRQLAIDTKTVIRYVDLLEKTFVITRLGGYSGNLRSEVVSKAKYYFLDNGIRNGIISQFNAIADRNDLGQLWENFIVVERLKKRTYTNVYGGSYFWRTYQQQQVDLVEERDGKLFGYECKWSAKTTTRPPRSWSTHYAEATFNVINPENYLSFVGE